VVVGSNPTGGSQLLNRRFADPIGSAFLFDKVKISFCHPNRGSVVLWVMLSLLYEVDGYRARVERDRDGVLHGRVLDIDEVITFKAISARFIERNFSLALYAYFERCRSLGIEPEQPKPVF
jgi:hypothetical protein